MARLVGIRMWRVIAPIAVIAIAARCHRTVVTASPRISSFTATNDSLRARLLKDTVNYSFGETRPAVLVDNSKFGGPGGSLPNVSIATATRTAPGGNPYRRISARLTSTGPFPSLGLGAGNNYVWYDTSSAGPGGRHRLLVIPVDPTVPMRWLSVEVTTDHPAPSEPMLLKNASGYEYCDNGCIFQHCNAFTFLRDLYDSDIATIDAP